MSGLEIFLLVLALAASIAILVLIDRNRALARGQKIWMDLAAARTAQPLPQAAETIGVIKQTNFDRATRWRDEQIADLERRTKSLERDLQTQRDDAHAAVAAVRRELDAERARRMHVAGLYASAERERSRLEHENKRLLVTLN